MSSLSLSHSATNDKAISKQEKTPALNTEIQNHETTQQTLQQNLQEELRKIQTSTSTQTNKQTHSQRMQMAEKRKFKRDVFQKTHRFLSAHFKLLTNRRQMYSLLPSSPVVLSTGSCTIVGCPNVSGTILAGNFNSCFPSKTRLELTLNTFYGTYNLILHDT